MSDLDRITIVLETLPGARAQVSVNINTPTPGMRLATPAHALAIDALGWLGKQPCVAGFVYGPLPQKTSADEFPGMTPELEKILGLMCFQCITFAQALRMGGHQIENRAEAEQAAVLHWMLGHYFRHGEGGWRAAATEDVGRMESAYKAAQGAAA
jgi:hypothetical protein